MVKDFENHIQKFSQLKDFQPTLNLILDNFTNLEIVNHQSFFLIEKIVKLILTERAITFEDNEKFNKLLKKIYKEFYFDKYDKNIISTLTTGLDNLSKSIEYIRDKKGGHGKVQIEKREELSKLIFKNSMSFCSFLWESHLKYAKEKIILEYKSNQEFNNWFDEERDDLKIEVFDDDNKKIELLFKPSEVLFVDKPAYKDEILKFKEIFRKSNLIEELSNSNCFAETDRIILELLKINKFADEEIEQLVDIVLDNPVERNEPWYYNQVRPKVLNNSYKSKEAVEFYQNLIKNAEKTDKMKKFEEELNKKNE